MLSTPKLPPNLRTHTEFSLLEGIIRINKIANQQSIAITDTHNMFGLHRFTSQCLVQHIHPITGCAIKINDKRIYLYAQNQEGYKNLCEILSKSQLSGLKSFNELCNHTNGLLALLPEDGDAQWVDDLQIGFNNRWAIALCNYGNGYETPAEMLKIASDLSIPLVASNAAYFQSADDYEAQDAFRCIASHEHVDAPNRKRLSKYHRLLSAEEWHYLFADAPHAVTNAELWATKCTFILENSKQTAYTSDAHSTLLSKMSHDGLAIKIANIQDKQQYYNQLEYELKIINQLGMAGYFLIVADYVRYARSQNIPVNCRGSGAGSVVAWAIEITNIDPLRFSLVFERFLNPERVSMADFDLDFCHNRRDEVIDYIRKKYGDENVAHIATFGTLQARAVLRDIGRVLGMRFYDIDAICKMIPMNPLFETTLDSARTTQKELDKMIESDPSIQRLWRLSEKLEGLPRHVSTHAAGIVISEKKLSENIPLYCDPGANMKVSGFDMYALEKVGFIKFDILGLSGLTMIQKIIDLLKADGIDLDINDIPLDDISVFEYLSTGNTYGIFQLDSMGIRQIIQQMQPRRIEDLVALNALYRPGPVQNIPQYIEYRRDPSKIPYIFPELQEVLGETYGIIVYQEQVLQIARIIAGYSLAEADLLRRAIGKKIESEMRKQKSIFTDRAIKLGRDKAKTEELFALIAKFAQYGFVKAHATCYAMMMYQMAYLKTHFITHFICVGMTMDSRHRDKLIQWKREADYAKIEILPPCIYHSTDVFIIEDNAIRYSLSALKNVGEGIAQEIHLERDIIEFRDIWDFIHRVKINKQALESLIKSGALDVFNIPREKMLANLTLLLHQPNAMLFAPIMSDADSWSHEERSQYIFSSIGMYIGEHPLNDLSDKVLYTLKINSTLKQESGMIIGYILQIDRRRTKAGVLYGILMISDKSGINEFSIFSELWDLAQKELKENDLVWCRIRVGRGLSIESVGLLKDGLPLTYLKCIVSETSDLKILKSLKPGSTDLTISDRNESWNIGKIKLDFDGIQKLDKFLASSD